MAQVNNFKTLQLWTNSGGKEFALKLGDAETGIFVAATHLGADYQFLVEEFNCENDMPSYWETVLQQKADTWSKSGNVREFIQSKESIPSGNSREFHPFKREPSTRLKRVKPALKCHFCYLMYIADEERIEHEKMWHAAKLQARAQ